MMKLDEISGRVKSDVVSKKIIKCIKGIKEGLKCDVERISLCKWLGCEDGTVSHVELKL